MTHSGTHQVIPVPLVIKLDVETGAKIHGPLFSVIDKNKRAKRNSLRSQTQPKSLSNKMTTKSQDGSFGHQSSHTNFIGDYQTLLTQGLKSMAHLFLLLFFFQGVVDKMKKIYNQLSLGAKYSINHSILKFDTKGSSSRTGTLNCQAFQQSFKKATMKIIIMWKLRIGKYQSKYTK